MLPYACREANVWQTVSHDGRGNVIDNGDVPHGAVNLTYDRAEQPVSMSGAASGSFRYDGNYKRVKQVVGGETIYSVYGLEGRLLYRDNATTNKLTEYVALAGMTFMRFTGSDIVFPHR